MKLSYSSYLQLAKILSSQKPLSRPLVNDELLFICVHQVFEIWFKVMIQSIQLSIGSVRRGDFRAAAEPIKRVTMILELFPQQLRVLETMSPQEFLKFRDNLMPASGLQSFQFRRMEFLLGLGDRRYFSLFSPKEVSLLEGDINNNLWQALMEKLSGGAKELDESGQLNVIRKVYSGTDGRGIREFCEALIELDESFLKYRQAHALLAERMIGYRPGTGKDDVKKIMKDSSFSKGGVDYLRRVSIKKCFPILWEARTFIR